MRTDMEVAQLILTDMGHDNGTNFHPCDRHLKDLVRAVHECRVQGLKFTTLQVSTFAYGEQTNQERLARKVKSGKKLNRVLGVIFDKCRDCAKVSDILNKL